jgi:hypothetical protein
MPGMVKSAPKAARPVTLSRPSGSDRTRADDLEVDRFGSCRLSPQFSAAASSTARMILS